MCNDSDRKTEVLWEKCVIWKDTYETLQKRMTVSFGNILNGEPQKRMTQTAVERHEEEKNKVKRDLKLFFVGRYEIRILLFIDPYTNRNDANTKNHLEEDVLHEDTITSNENVYVPEVNAWRDVDVMCSRLE